MAETIQPILTKENLAQFIGTEYYYKYLMGIKLTDGVKYLAEVGKAFWFLDIIASYQTGKIRKIPFQVWTLKVDLEKETAVVTMKEDMGRPDLVTQTLDYTDFPLDEVSLWLIDGILILPSEY